MVMVDDDELRANRLALLQTLFKEFSTIADFSEIVTEGKESKESFETVKDFTHDGDDKLSPKLNMEIRNQPEELQPSMCIPLAAAKPTATAR